MTLLSFAATVTLGSLVGILIGCIGIGGVTLVPALHYLGGIPIPVAIAGAMMGYLMTGAVGTAIYAWEKSIRWSMALWLCAGAMPAALAGAWTSNNVPPVVLEVVIALLTSSAGVYSLMDTKGAEDGVPALSGGGLLLIGAVTGFGSAVSGTGGPLILIPLLLWLQVPVLTAIGLAQAVQLPIATLATAGNFLYGKPDILLGFALAVGLAGGAAIGARLAHVAPRAILRRIVSIVLIAVGLLILSRIVQHWLSLSP